MPFFHLTACPVCFCNFYATFERKRQKKFFIEAQTTFPGTGSARKTVPPLITAKPNVLTHRFLHEHGVENVTLMLRIRRTFYYCHKKNKAWGAHVWGGGWGLSRDQKCKLKLFGPNVKYVKARQISFIELAYPYGAEGSVRLLGWNVITHPAVLLQPWCLGFLKNEGLLRGISTGILIFFWPMANQAYLLSRWTLKWQVIFR